MWDEMTQDIRDELLDPAFASRTHGTRGTYAQGCHGPLCRESERIRGNSRFESNPLPELEARYALLASVTAWHREQRGLGVLAAS